MCGEYILGDYTWREYREALRIIREEDPPNRPSHRARITNMLPIIVPTDGGTQVVNARWSLVPRWFKGPVKEWKAATFNARIESAHEKPSFRDAWKRTRCLVPAHGWAEWTGPKGSKQRWFLTLERNQPLIFFAGLFSRLPDGLVTFTIVVRDADPAISKVHNRMPVILRDTQYDDWLACADLTETDLGTGFGKQLIWHMVRPVEGDNDSLIDPYDEVLL